MRYALIALMLAGCVALTPEQRAAQFEKTIEQAIATYGPGCEKLGLQSPSKQWADCVAYHHTQDQMRAQRAAQAWALGLQRAGQAFERQAVPQAVPQQTYGMQPGSPSNPYTCRTVGDQMTCSSLY